MILDVELIENEQRIDATLDSVIAVGGGEDSGQFWDFYQQNGTKKLTVCTVSFYF